MKQTGRKAHFFLYKRISDQTIHSGLIDFIIIFWEQEGRCEQRIVFDSVIIHRDVAFFEYDSAGYVAVPQCLSQGRVRAFCTGLYFDTDQAVAFDHSIDFKV